MARASGYRDPSAHAHPPVFFRRSVPFEHEFRRLVDRWGGYVRQTLLALDHRRSASELEDIEQEIRLRLWQVLSRERNWDKPASFIRSVVLSVAIDAARRRQARGGDSEHLGLESLDPAAGEAAGVEERTELLAVLEGLQRVDPEKAEAVGLYLQGFTTQEIGTLLGWTEAKARNIVYRSLDAVRAAAAGPGSSDDAER
ncbi:MAG: hypothetical protein AMXMBFR25_19110 [Lysobacterales bacterium]|nr:hypothetical protein [Xanthomonadales bacterium]